MLDIVGQLQTEKDAFTRSERALTEIVLADVESVLKMSIVDLAAQAEVSPPTVTRFCRRLGCESYADFKVRLAQSRFVGQRYFAPTAGPTSVPEIAAAVPIATAAVPIIAWCNLPMDSARTSRSTSPALIALPLDAT